MIAPLKETISYLLCNYEVFRSKTQGDGVCHIYPFLIKLTRIFFMALFQKLHHGQSFKRKGECSALACDIQALTVSRKKIKNF